MFGFVFSVGFVLTAGEAGFAGFPRLGDFDEDAGGELGLAFRVGLQKILEALLGVDAVVGIE